MIEFDLNGRKLALDEAVVRELNDRIAADERVVAVQLTVRDGVTMIRRAS